VSAAVGGVGSIAVQLARRAGAKVIGIASPANHAWLSQHGVEAVAYGEGLADQLRKFGLNAFIDCHDGGYVSLAIELGAPKDRIDTIVDFAAAQGENRSRAVIAFAPGAQNDPRSPDRQASLERHRRQAMSVLGELITYALGATWSGPHLGGGSRMRLYATGTPRDISAPVHEGACKPIRTIRGSRRRKRCKNRSTTNTRT
jgi:hypothetical protein